MIENVTNTLENKLYPFLDDICCEDTILVGHSLENDLKAMKLIHRKVIDSSVLFMAKSGTKSKLKSLAHRILNVTIKIFREKYRLENMIHNKIVWQHCILFVQE